MDDALVLQLIQSGAQAGAYLSLARELPEAKSGLLKMANKHNRVGARLMDELVRRDRGDPELSVSGR